MRGWTAGLVAAGLVLSTGAPVTGQTRTPERVTGGEWVQMSRPELVETSAQVMARPAIPFTATEEIIRIRSLEMDWDIAGMVYAPKDPSAIPLGADGKKAGLFLLHGGSSDHRSMDRFARFLVSKYGYKIVTMSYPGRLNLQDPSRDWPGDTIKGDGTVRTPVWLRDSLITPDQYTIVEDKEESRRRRWGTLILACAKEGTEFYDRMAGWPVAFEEGGKALLAKHLPQGEFSIYAHGHSTGGPFTMIFSQRVPNVAGIIGMESSPFGEMYGEVLRSAQNIEEPWGIGFECLRIRSWRDTARYAGYEAIQEEGLKALERLPMLMEEIHESWAKSTKTAQFKAENMIHFDSPEALTEAAKAVAKRLKLDEAGTKAMVDRYLGYRRELSGPGTKPMPPVFSIIAKNSRDHTPEGYKDFYLPFYSRMKPAPKVMVVQVDAGTHGYSAAEEGLPMGIAPVGAHLWYKAITGGFYATPGQGSAPQESAAPQETADEAAIKIGGTARERFPAFRLIGNVHYVGSSNAGAFLLTTPEGHVLIDSGYPKTEAWIRESIESLGFKLSDVRIMLNTHAHADHVGGHARLKEWTGARVLTSAADKPVLADGGRSDFRSDGSLLWLPVVADGTVSDGQKISLGGITLVAHLTPGHTRGNTTWTTTVTEAGKTYQVVFAGSMGLNANVPLTGNTKYPGIADDYRRSFAKLKSLPCDVFLPFHAQHYDLPAKKAKLDAGATPNPFVDPGACRAYYEKNEKTFLEQVSAERQTR